VKGSGELANSKTKTGINTKTGIKLLDWQKETYPVPEEMIIDTRVISTV